MKVVLLGPESCPYAQILRQRLSTAWQLECAESPETIDAAMLKHLRDATALISIRFDASLPMLPSLRLLQVPSTGINSIRLDHVPRGVTVCNSYGHETAVAEYIVGGMLMCAHDLMNIHTGFRAGQWFWSGAAPVMHAEICGKTVCIVGMGRIGMETARRASALGMHVIGCNRTLRPTPDVHEMLGLDGIVAAASRADFLVVNCALADATRGIVGEAVLRAMRPSAFVVNVGRGELIDETALYDALRERTIAGAVLDVWYQYPSREQPHPRPSRYAFHELDNVIMTPHVSGWTDGMVARRWAQIADNLDRLARGQPLSNVIVHGTAAKPP